MSHSNSFPTLITVSQQLNQAHFQQTATSQMQHNAVVNSQILFPQSQQTMSIQSAQNGAMTSNQQLNNGNNNNKQIQHNRQFQQQQQQHLTIPLQLGTGNHAFTAAGIPLDLSYFVQGGCLPNCLPIQLTGPGGLQQGFQAALNCVNTSTSDQQQVQVSQSDPGTGNSFLQFNVAYPTQQQSQHNIIPTFQTVMQSSTNDNHSNIGGCKPQAKRKKKATTATASKSSDKLPITNVVERFHSVAVQTDFDMSLCRQQIVVVPPKNCTCGAVAQALASGAFQAASFPPGPRRNDKKMKRSCSIKTDASQSGDVQRQTEETPLQQQQQQQQQQQEQIEQMSPQEQAPIGDQCNGAPAQPSCDNRGRPFSYECLYCPKRFSLHSRLVAHLRCHTGMRPFSCLQCGYSFTQRSYLNRHAAVHKQERPFSCLSCHKTYKHYGSLANHRKLHSKDTSDPSVNEASAVSESALPPASSANSTVTTQLFTVSSSIASPQMFGSAATAHPAMMTQMFPVSTAIPSMTASQMFHGSSSSTPTAASQQMFQVSSTTAAAGTSQMFPSASQPMATFYQTHDASGFLLSLNSSAASSTGGTGAMLVLHPSNNPITVPSSSSTYVPIMSSSAFS